MKLHAAIITHNRLHLTKQVLASLEDTCTIPYTRTVVDNASTDGTQEWLRESLDSGEVLLLDDNYYAGFATNRGWELAPSDATHFLRSDNDFRFLSGWCDEVEERFRDDTLGQLGLRTDAEENYVVNNVGGMTIIRRELWDRGLRWEERRWGEYPPAYGECAFFSIAVTQLGYRWGRVLRPCVELLEVGSWDDPYYQQSWSARDIRMAADRKPGTM